MFLQYSVPQPLCRGASEERWRYRQAGHPDSEMVGCCVSLGVACQTARQFSMFSNFYFIKFIISYHVNPATQEDDQGHSRTIVGIQHPDSRPSKV